jgi:hypothetical protein
MSGQTTPRTFHIGDILSVTTGYLVSLEGIAGVYDILNYMTGESLYTHQLPRAWEACAPALLAQHPQLGDVDMRGVTNDNLDARLADAADTYGEYLPVASLDTGVYEARDPLAELAAMTDKPIVVVGVDR